ncbi:class I SAM-dependent methyltransferase [Haloglomus halophilum]|uniref:class I SAM-dependent methyltransferase n=1 Tax=Haloglomus halophilum TaxID=2962672 RepID=UPI0020CA13C5|nr:class I SAM-dependent methyltransferase [Haloglomus halophilum]
MGFHTYDAERADALEDPGRYEYVSVDELLALFDPEGEVADLGSGTGFYTDDVVPYAGTVHAVDVQAEMHDFYREKGAPDNVRFVTAEVADLPFADDVLDRAFSTMTYHEFASPEALRELARVVRPGGVVGIADWSAAGEGGAGPPRAERFAAAEAVAAFEDVGFTVERAEERRETFVLRAVLG